MSFIFYLQFLHPDYAEIITDNKKPPLEKTKIKFYIQ